MAYEIILEVCNVCGRGYPQRRRDRRCAMAGCPGELVELDKPLSADDWLQPSKEERDALIRAYLTERGEEKE